MKILIYIALIQTHFDYGCTSRSPPPLLNKNLKYKVQAAPKKMHPTLPWSTPRSHIGSIHLRKINLLPVSERVESCIATVANILKRDCTIIYQWYIQAFIQKLYISLSKLNTEQQPLSFLGPKIWNKHHSIENVKTTASFAHALKRNFSKLCGLTS